MSNCCANSASVLSPFTAAKATLALKAGVWFRRGRLDMVLLLIRGDLRRCQAEIPLIPLFRFAEPALSSVFLCRQDLKNRRCDSVETGAKSIMRLSSQRYCYYAWTYTKWQSARNSNLQIMVINDHSMHKPS